MKQFQFCFSFLICTSIFTNAYGQSSYEFGLGSLIPRARDVCKRPEFASAIIKLLNGKVGFPDGTPSEIVGTDLSTTENESIDGPTLTCRGLLQTSSGPIGPGNVAVRVGGRDMPEDAKWLSDADKQRAEVAFRNPVRYVTDGSMDTRAGTNQPKWILRSRVNGRSDYLDVDNIRRKGNIVSIWHLQDFQSQMGVAGKNQFRSIKYQLEFDCRAGRNRLLYFASFDETVGRGTVVDGGKHAGDWKSVADGEKDDKRYACDIVY